MSYVYIDKESSTKIIKTGREVKVFVAEAVKEKLQKEAEKNGS